MWKKFITFLLLICSMQYVGTARVSKRYVNSGSGAGAGAGAGAFAGTSSGYFGEPGFGYGFPTPPFHFAGPIGPEEFHRHFADYFLALQKQQAAAASMTYATQDATASASTSLFPSDNLFKHQFEHQRAIMNSIQQQAGTVNGYGGPNYAAASASYSPNGIHHSTYISPPNPASPNINTRFASSGQPGFYGVSTSSFSESSDINGQKSSRRGAITKVNDNGKVTTYQSHS